MKSKSADVMQNADESHAKIGKKRKRPKHSDDDIDADDSKPDVKKATKSKNLMPTGIDTDTGGRHGEKAPTNPSVKSANKRNSKVGAKQKPKKSGNLSDKKKPQKVLHASAKKLKLPSKESTKTKSEKKSVSADSDEVSKTKKKTKLEEMTKKDRKKARKMKNSHFDMSTKAKALWEEFRRSDLGPERQQACSDELLRLIKGNALALVFAHDTSRVIQWLIKRGTAQQRDAVFNELKDHLVDMMMSKYAKFFVNKLLKYGTKAQRDAIFTAIKGKLRKLLRHREAAAIVETAYNNYAQASQRMAMAAVFYGKTFNIFRTPEEKTLRAFVNGHPEKREDVLTFLKDSLVTLANKSILQHSFVHHLFLEFFSCANETQRSEMIETIREHVVHMLHTHDGARVTMMCLWHGTAKDRKVIIKSFKTFVVKISKEEFGFMVLLALFDVVDDTKIVQKAVLDELLKSLDEVAADKYGRKVLLYLLLPRDPVHFHPDIVAVLQQGDANRHSKKDATIRHNELLAYISPKLLHWLAANCRQLMKEGDSQLLVLSAVKHCTGDATEAMTAIAEIVAEPFESGSHVVDDAGGHLVLKRLILNDADRIKLGQTVLFSTILLDTVPADRLQSWTACNRGCFMLVSLLEMGDVSVGERIKKCLVGVKETLECQQNKLKGAEVLLNKLNGQVSVNRTRKDSNSTTHKKQRNTAVKMMEVDT